MKSNIVCVMVLVLSLTSFAGMTFEDIDVWVGQGQNEAALVIDWNDGQDELVKVWGFRWDGTATGADMLLAVCQADASLYTMGVNVAGLGIAFGGIGYDVDADGFDITKDGVTSNFDAYGFMQIVQDTEFDSWTSTDADDNWSSGWWSDGFWGYSYINPGLSDWTGSMVGASSRTLADGSWDGWSWGSAENGWYGGNPSVIVPEPLTFVLLGAGMLLARKRQ